MDKRWKNVFLLLVVIAVLLVFTYLFQGETFSVTGSGVNIFY